MRRTERYLLGFREKIVWVTVKSHFTDGHDGHEFLGNEFGRVQHVEAEFFRLLFGEDLHAEFVLGVGARFDRFPQIAAVEVGIGPGDLDRLIPIERMGACQAGASEILRIATRRRH